MAIRNQSWYGLNSSRDYPLDDTASAISGKDKRLPSDIIVDIRIRWPDLVGTYAFLGSVAVTPGAVTATVLASPDLSNSSNTYTPIAVISVPRTTLQPGKQYALQPMYPGAFGYIVFGSGTSESWSGNFSSPAQALLTPKSARPYASLPVSSLSRLYDETPLTGVINLAASDPLEIVAAEREIGGIARDVIVIRLREETANILTDDTQSSFETFAGQCGKRPESRNCGDPIPIETINAVGPDCDGIICLEFKGCAVVGKNTDDCGVVVDCGIGLSDTCAPPALPDMEGILPSEKRPEMPPIPPDPEPIVPPEESVTEGVVTSITLPHCDSFSDLSADYFSQTDGSWSFFFDNSPDDLCDNPYIPPHWVMTDSCSESDSDSCSVWDPGQAASQGYSYETGSSSTKNISIFTPDAQTVYRTYQTDLKMLPGVAGTKHNGGILVNNKTTPSGGNTFYLLELDYDDAEFRLVYFNSFTYVTLSAQSLPSLGLGKWYNLEFSVVPVGPHFNTIELRGKFTGAVGGTYSDPVSIITVSISHVISAASYLEDSELSGLHTNRGLTRFSYWRVSEQTS
tara:strand:- start:3997 stop:5706 length:1710 start_codon:yes stop_codon:yes gene_type:complete